MEFTVWINEVLTTVLCVGRVEYERISHTRIQGTVDNFQVYVGNDEVTAQLDKSDLQELEYKYLTNCMLEAV